MNINIYFMKIQARCESEASKKLKIKYPNSKIISYKYEINYTLEPKHKRDYSNRYMIIAYIKNVTKIKKNIENIIK